MTLPDKPNLPVQPAYLKALLDEAVLQRKRLEEGLMDIEIRLGAIEHKLEAMLFDLARLTYEIGEMRPQVVEHDLGPQVRMTADEYLARQQGQLLARAIRKVSR